MPLTNEKENILNIASANKRDVFPHIDKAESTYYKKYDSSKHMGSVVMEYDSDFNVFRNNIDSMWKDEESSQYKGDVLSAMYKCKDNEESLMEAIDLFNYMM